MEPLSREMYQEHILDLYKDPSNFGKLKGFTNDSHSFNPLCGDEVTVQLIVKKDKIEDVKFHGHGCAISIAASSMVTDKVKAMKVKDVLDMKKDDMLQMLGIPISAVRLKCALLCLETIHKAIQGGNDDIIRG